MSLKPSPKEIVAFLGVIVSLAMVAYEIHQNTMAVRAQTLQAIAEQAAEISFLGVGNPELRVALEKGFGGDPSDMTTAEKTLLGWYYAGVMRVAENRFRQYQLGVVGEESLGQFGGYAMVFRNTYFKAWWPGARFQFPADFVEYVDTMLIPLEMPSG